MLRIEAYTTTEGLACVVSGIDTRWKAHEDRLEMCVMSTIIGIDTIEELGLDRALCTAIAEAIQLQPDLAERAMM